MQRNGRKLLYAEERVRAMFARMRDELRAVSLARSRAEVELAELRRLRDIGRARLAQRDPATTPLH